MITNKTALIVDDSPIARHVLSRLLADHGLHADTAASAEDALDYLKQRRPDVVFMDHMMPGMDGFEALEAIKRNPATATIPVMMYTSQAGELYVGQARALGAFGVLPKELKPVEVTRVLKALHLIPGDAARDEASAHSIVPAKPADPADSQRVAALLEELFYQQRSALREEIREGYQRAIATTQAQLPEPPQAPPARLRLSRVAAAALLVTTVTFGYLYFHSNQLLQQAAVGSMQLIASTAELNAASADALERQPPPPANEMELLEVAAWAFNLSGGYGFQAVPLDDERATSIGRLIQVLNRTSFSGTVDIGVHVGRFCMNYSDEGLPVLAPNDQRAQDCDQVGWSSTDAEALGRRQSLVFANTVAMAGDSGRVRVTTTSHGSEQPAYEYPPLIDYTTAGEWNAIAAKNHRVEVQLNPDAG